jgi:protoporphyrinogen oxidase
MTKVAILGGGPGGLMTAYQLEQKHRDSCQITLFEASGRTGGKIVTTQFDSAPVIYEAGAAEF